MSDRVLVLGVGNPLVEDEGVGVAVLARLAEDRSFPETVELLDCGTMGMGILGLFREAQRVLVIDAVDGTGQAPGTVVRLKPEDIGTNEVPHSLHDVRLIDVLQAAELIGGRPEVEFVGVQVKSMRSMVEGLTPEVEAALPTAVDAALTVLQEWGITAEE